MAENGGIGTEQERTIGQLVAEATADLSAIVKAEIALAKAELAVSAKNGALAGGLFGAAGYLGFLSSITLVVTIGYALTAAGLPAWAAFGIVTLALLLLAGLLALIGRGRIKKVRAPERAIESAKATIAAVKPATSRQ